MNRPPKKKGYVKGSLSLAKGRQRQKEQRMEMVINDERKNKSSLFDIPPSNNNSAKHGINEESVSKNTNIPKPEYHFLHEYFTGDPHVSGTFKRIEINKKTNGEESMKNEKKKEAHNTYIPFTPSYLSESNKSTVTPSPSQK